MKLIEALKKEKDLMRKADDIRGMVHQNHVHYNYETAPYGDRQGTQVKEWIQAFHDVLAEILKLRLAVQRTNLETSVDIDLGGKTVSKSIAAWIHRRRFLAAKECEIWSTLDDKNLKEGRVRQSTDEIQDVKLVRYYDPAERDDKRELFRSEPGIIDRTLEVVNATTDLIE